MKRYVLGVYEKAMPGTLTWKEKMLSAGESPLAERLEEAEQ